MKSHFGFFKTLHKLYLAPATWMLSVRGEGGLEIKNQGRFGYSKSFSQETGANGQQSSRNDGMRPKLNELSAGCTLNSDPTPLFSFSRSDVFDVAVSFFS